MPGPRVDPFHGDPDLPGSVDVVVIGGGIIGTSTTLELAERGLKVALCEKGGIVCSWRGISASFDKAAILAFSASIRPVSWLIWSRSIWQISRARSGMSASGSAMTRSRRGK